MIKFYIIESEAYHRGSTGVAYCADNAEQASAIIKSKKNPWINNFVTFDGVTFPDYIWTVEKIEKTMRKGA